MVLAKYQVDPSCGWLPGASHFTFRVLAFVKLWETIFPGLSGMAHCLPPLDQLSRWPTGGTCAFRSLKGDFHLLTQCGPGSWLISHLGPEWCMDLGDMNEALV